MAEYGTIEYYKEEIKKNELEKEIYLNALENMSRRDFKDYSLLEIVAEKIAGASSNIKFYSRQLAELYKAETEKQAETEQRNSEV
jgi:hypothetical protein